MHKGNDKFLISKHLHSLFFISTNIYKISRCLLAYFEKLCEFCHLYTINNCYDRIRIENSQYEGTDIYLQHASRELLCCIR